MSTKTIKIAKEFSRAPGPRYTKLGPHSGERFRDELLIPALRNFDQVVVDLDGTFGYGSSFLEEAFGGLLRSGVSIDTASTIEFVSGEEPDLIDEIREYIESAARRAETAKEAIDALLEAYDEVREKLFEIEDALRYWDDET